MSTLPPPPGEPPPTASGSGRLPPDSGSGRIDPPAEPLRIGSRVLPPSLGRYQVTGPMLGIGGMGAVVVAIDPAMRRRVALKVLLAGKDASQDEIRRFLREARATAALSDPRIVRVHDTGEDQGWYFLVMDLIEGEPLTQWIARDGVLDQREAGRVAREMAEALDHAHMHGVLHRDLKPANVVVTPEGEVRLIDFGLAKNTRNALGQSYTQVPASTLNSVIGNPMGSPPYMPPEQVDGEWDRVDRRADVYGIGATLYEMLTGQPPFPGQTVIEIYNAVIFKDPQPPTRLHDGLDRDLETVCLKCLEKEPERRYESAEALADDLNRFLEDLPIKAERPGVLRRLQKFARRNSKVVGTLAAVAALLVVAGLATLVWWLQQPAQLEVTSDPAGVMLALFRDGQEVGRRQTPATFEVPPGTYQVKGVDPRFEEALVGLGEVTLARGQERSVVAVPQVRTAELSLDVTPRGTAIAGEGPSGATLEATAPWKGRLAPGKWTIRLEQASYLPQTFDVALTPGGGKVRTVSLQERLLWQYASKGYGRPVVADLDGDGIPEILRSGRTEGRPLVCLAPSGELLWELEHPGQGHEGPLVADLDRDGTPEILVPLKDKTLLCVSPARKVLWSFPCGAAARTPRVVDLDGDGTLEVLAWYEKTGGAIACLTPQGQVKWTWVSEASPIRRPDVIDLDGDGALEVVATSRRSLVCISSAGQELWRRSVGELSSFGRPSDMFGGVVGVRQEGRAELLVAILSDAQSSLSCLRASGEVRWTHTMAGGEGPCAVQGVDLNGKDGASEIIIVSRSGPVQAISSGGKLLWEYRAGTTLGSGRDLLTVDLDRDGGPEVLVTTDFDSVYCLSSQGKLRWSARVSSGRAAPDLCAADLDGDGLLEVVVGTVSEVSCLVGASSPLQWSQANSSHTMSASQAGPWLLMVGSSPVAFDVSSGRSHALPWASSWYRATWDSARRRILLPGRGRVVAWRPGVDHGLTLSKLELPAGLALADQLLLVSTLDGHVAAYDLQRPRQLLWKRRVGGRVEAAPLPLDLDGDGKAERALVATTAAELVLLDLEGAVLARLDAPATVRYRPQPLGPARAGSLPVLVACQDGTLLRVEVRSRRLVLAKRRALGHPLSCGPSHQDLDGDGRADRVLAGTWRGWLFSLGAELDRVEWAVHDGRGFPIGNLTSIDLDGDGVPEVASSWEVPVSFGKHDSSVRIYEREGVALARLHAGIRFFLSGSRQALVGGGATMARRWGRWPRLQRPTRRPSLRHALDQLAAGAYGRVRAETRQRRGSAARLLGALASWHAGNKTPLRRLLSANRPGVRRQVETWARGLAKAGERSGVERLLKPLGLRLNTRRPDALRRIKTQSTPTRLRVDFSKAPTRAQGWELSLAGGGFRETDLPITGLLLQQRGRLRARFRLEERNTVTLGLRHSALANHIRGFASIRISLDGRQVQRVWEAPSWRTVNLSRTGRWDRFPLGLLEPGPHTLEIQVLPGAATLYSLLELKIELEK